MLFLSRYLAGVGDLKRDAIKSIALTACSVSKEGSPNPPIAADTKIILARKLQLTLIFSSNTQYKGYKILDLRGSHKL